MESTKLVHDTLTPVLVEAFGAELKVADSPAPEGGSVVYQATIGAASCSFVACDFSSEAASVAIEVRVGRLYSGYRRGLRWLACNRAGNSLALSVSLEGMEQRELVLCSQRITRPGDTVGIRDQLRDVHFEVDRVYAALLVHFPGLLRGAELAHFERLIAEGDDALPPVLADPLGFLRWVAEVPDKHNAPDHLVARVAQWVRRWDLAVEYYERSWANWPTADKTPEIHSDHLLRSAANLVRLGEPTRALERIAEAKALGVNQNAASLIKAGALYALGHYEDILDELRSAELDEAARTWYWRAIAHLRLGNVAQWGQDYQQYENMVGVDILARQSLKEIKLEQ